MKKVNDIVRIHWVDIAKGILITMVVVYHLPFVARDFIHNNRINCMITLSEGMDGFLWLHFLY